MHDTYTETIKGSDNNGRVLDDELVQADIHDSRGVLGVKLEHVIQLLTEAHELVLISTLIYAFKNLLLWTQASPVVHVLS